MRRSILFYFFILSLFLLIVGCSDNGEKVVANVGGEEIEITKEEFNEKKFEPTGIYHEVIIENEGFDPARLEISVGDGIEFVNDNVKSFNLVFENGDFDETIKTGQVVRHDFLQIGTVRYFEVTRPDVIGEIVVNE